MTTNRQAYDEGLVARDRHEHILPYPSMTTMAMFWLRGLNGMQYKNQKEGELEHKVLMLQKKLDRVVAKNAMPADEFMKARLDAITNELTAMTLEYEHYMNKSVELQKTIDKLALKMSREKKQLRRGEKS